MIDFGLSGLLDRIERDYGRRVAKGLTGLMGLTIVVACLLMIVPAASTTVVWVSGQLSGGWAQTLLAAAQMVVGLLILVFLANNIVAAIEMKRRLRKMSDLEDEVRTLRAGVDDHLDRLEAAQKTSNRQADLMKEMALKLLVQAEALSKKREATEASASHPDEQSGPRFPPAPGA